MEKSKSCKKCHKLLSLSSFYRHYRYKDGHKNVCGKCENAQRQKYREKKKQLQISKYQESFLDKTHFNKLHSHYIKNFSTMSQPEQTQKLKQLYEFSQLLELNKKRFFVVSRFDEETEGLINYELSITHRQPIIPPHVETRHIKDKIIIVMPEDQCIPLDIQNQIKRKLHL